METPRYIVCPVWLLTENKIKDIKSAVLLGLLASLADSDGQVKARNSELAKTMKCSDRTLQRNISELKRLGYIKTVTDDCGGRSILVDETLLKEVPEHSYDTVKKSNESDTTNTLLDIVNLFDKRVTDLGDIMDQFRNFLKIYGKNIGDNTKAVTKNMAGESSYDRIINEMVSDVSVKAELYEYIKMRKMIKKPMTDRALVLLINKLRDLSKNADEAVQILDQSITGSWMSVYPLKEDRDYQGWQGNGRKGVTKEDVSDFEGL